MNDKQRTDLCVNVSEKIRNMNDEDLWLVWKLLGQDVQNKFVSFAQDDKDNHVND